MRVTILTNNEKVITELKECNNLVDLSKKDYLDVLYKARDLIYNDYRILIDPRSRDINYEITPFKSILLSYSGSRFDLKSLEMIEKSIENTKKLIENDKIEYQEGRLEDYKTSDYFVIKDRLEEISRLN